jgi:DNA-binding transcriptional LysR family regulator
MNLGNLQLFVEVVRRGSFAAVARDRDSAPSSVSRAIRSLETELGVRLFQRSTRRLELTEVGQQYFASVEGLIEELRRAGEQATELTETPSGTLRVTAPVTFGQIGIIPLLPEFTRRYPALDIELVLTDNQLDLLVERIDVAIRLGSLSDSAYVATRLCSEPFVVCASPDYLARSGRPGEPAELSHHDCLRLHLVDYSTWQFRHPSGRVENVAIRSRVVISNALALKQCALADMGITLLPRWVVQRELASGELTELFGDYAVGANSFEVPVWLLYPSRPYLPLKVRVFADYVREAFRQAPPWKS